MSIPAVLATGCLDHKIRFWDATSGHCTKSLLFGESQVNCIQISLDKRLLVAGGNPYIHVYDINTSDEKPILVYDGHTNNVTSVGFQRDLKWVYSSSEDGTIKIWDSRHNIASKTFDCGAGINSVALSPNQNILISGDQNGFVRVWDLEASDSSSKEEHLPLPDVPVRSISIASDASIVAVGSHKGGVFVYTFTESKGGLQLTLSFQAHESYLLKIVLSPDVTKIATTSADKTIKIWDSATGRHEKTLCQHQKWVWDAVFSNDSLLIVTASSDLSCKLWDWNAGEVVRNYTGHGLAVTCVALNDI